jgi:hypothetical protein
MVEILLFQGLKSSRPFHDGKVKRSISRSNRTIMGVAGDALLLEGYLTVKALLSRVVNRIRASIMIGGRRQP